MPGCVKRCKVIADPGVVEGMQRQNADTQRATCGTGCRSDGGQVGDFLLNPELRNNSAVVVRNLTRAGTKFAPQPRHGQTTAVLRAAIIGTGRIATQHLLALQALPGVRTVAACDNFHPAAQAACRRFGVEGCFDDHRRLPRETKPDVVHITTPPATHAAIAREVLAAGCHAILEKPATTDAGDLESLISLAARNGRVLTEDQTTRFSSPVLALRDRMARGDCGNVRHLDIDYALPVVHRGASSVRGLAGGAIGHFLPHLSHLFHEFMGPHDGLTVQVERSDETAGLPVTALRAFVHAGDRSALLSFSTTTRPSRLRARVSCERILLHADVFEGTVFVEDGHTPPTPLSPLATAARSAAATQYGAWRSLFRKLRGEPVAGMEGVGEFLRQTYAALAAGAPVPVDAVAMRESARLIDDITAGLERP